MNQPQEIDPCAPLVSEIERVDAKISEYTTTLADPDGLTSAMKKHFEDKLSGARKQRDRLMKQLDKCRGQQHLQSEEPGPCASIRNGIIATEERIDSDRFDLRHPEDLLPNQIQPLKDDLAQAERELQDLRKQLRDCEGQHSNR